MSTVKLIKDGKIIERNQFDWEKNMIHWKLRGWDLLDKPAEDTPAEEKPKRTRKKKDD